MKVEGDLSVLFRGFSDFNFVDVLFYESKRIGIFISSIQFCKPFSVKLFVYTSHLCCCLLSPALQVPCPHILDPAEKYISLIVPAYSEDLRLPGALDETLNHLQQRAAKDKSFSYEFPAGLKVLVVDDDPTCLMILEKMLIIWRLWNFMFCREKNLLKSRIQKISLQIIFVVQFG